MKTQSEFSSRSVLLVDDEPGMRTALQANFLRHGWRVETAAGVCEALQAVERHDFDLIVSDMRMRDGDGLEVLASVRKTASRTAVILLTAFGSVAEAVESMRHGAVDYLTKPVSFDLLQATAARVMQTASSCPVRPSQTREAKNTPLLNAGIVGRSPLLLQTLQRARAAASTDADILIEAESGTGKELLARFLHEVSHRCGKPFVAINCAAVPEHLIESELFGHAKGAYTGADSAKAGKFELANGGTLLLDEVGEMPLNLQPKLLRVLQEREFERLGETRSIHVDIRVISTTNAALASMVEQGKFRSDLYYRLNVIPLSLSPLCDRYEDIPVLAAHFAQKFASERSCEVPVLDSSFLQRLQQHNWPGNVRELGNFMRRVLSLHQDVVVDAHCFDQEFDLTSKLRTGACSMPAPGTRLAEIEKLHLENTLALANGNRTHAAEMLGISLRTVRNKIREYGLPPRRYA